MDIDLPILPIQSVLPELKKRLARHRSVILAAEPGSGKTTVVPLAVMEEPWLNGKKIIILEPRRLAARMAARRMSEIAGDAVGGLVGYRIRFETQISARTRIEVVTEGILTRMMQGDPELSGVGLVVFDEFHERTLAADLALALCLDVQELRDDLKVMIMSATMDTKMVSQLLGDAPVVTGKGRCFPVDVQYLSRPSADFLTGRTVKAIRRAIAEQTGDILVFLPGAAEINAVQRKIDASISCLTLYGNLPGDKQDLVFAPAAGRRLILATPIAETSLTIEGIAVVIDSGLVKIPRFVPATGLTTLRTVAISKASAEQRAGRAGRLGPGTCYRLWTKAEHHSKPDFFTPEIVDADLAPLLLEVLLWGVSGPAALSWLDLPRAGQVTQACELLAGLGAVDAKGSLTPLGRELGTFPLHPRLALMLLYGRDHGCAPLACRLAALLQNRDLFRGHEADRSADIEDRLEVLRLFENSGAAAVRNRGADSSLCRRVLQEAGQYQRLLGVQGGDDDPHECGNLLAFAYPDRIAMKRKGSGQHQLSSGRGVMLAAGDHLQQNEFLVAAHVDGGRVNGRIFLGAALSRQEIVEHHGHLLSREERVAWNNSRVEALSIVRLGFLEIDREPLVDADPDRLRHCLLMGIREEGIHCLGWQKKGRELQARMQAAHEWDPRSWPDVSDAALIADLSWIEPYLDSVTTVQQLNKIDVYPILLSLLTWQEHQELEMLVPTHLQVPSGSRIRLQYLPGQPPILPVRLQEMFGAMDTPTIYGGKIPVLVHLMSPAGRPVQITRDLAGFWQNAYHDVKKELKGRYPKHYWPDDPLGAEATSRVKQRKV